MPRKKVPINRRASIKLVHSIAVHPRFLILVIATALAAIASIALGIMVDVPNGLATIYA